ncbi:MAG: hypothetical protein QNL04_13790 [SAR324 cluster bacterium]|nr:hypothetical protein [SAR324 cluster bacterium]
MKAPKGFDLFKLEFRSNPERKAVGWCDQDLKVWHIEESDKREMIVDHQFVRVLEIAS